ncbi:bifunctional riboflavin kinase/FAD synthetase [Hominifimenecus sp. rT4P-3]|uniref:bifunctional riboflavin kinase/FAD synthetase n=1 Tax=Hominifimenecus sp. rT4P-3 TaxID=3242979 RepID=UPI003DA460F5
MRYIHDAMDFQLESPAIVTLGKFDGFHRGHQKLMRQAAALRKNGEKLVVFTFAVSPQSYLSGRMGDCLTTRAEKNNLAEELGADVLIEYPFTDQVRRMKPTEFLQKVLVGQCRAAKIVVGPDCRFGYGGRGNVGLLQERSDSLGYCLTVVDKELYHEEAVSSSRIKDCLRQGQIREANQMLGYRYGVRGPVVHGRRLGRTLGVPTINQCAPEEQLMPKSGVYLARIEIIGGVYFGVANVGRKPTIDGERPVGIETYLFDFSRDVYGQEAKVEFLEFLRPERKFVSVEELKQQILQDEQEAKRILESLGKSNLGG